MVPHLLSSMEAVFAVRSIVLLLATSTLAAGCGTMPASRGRDASPDAVITRHIARRGLPSVVAAVISEGQMA